MYKYLTIVFLLLRGLSFSQENPDSSNPSVEALSGDNLIVSWTLGEVVASYGGFDKLSNNEHINHTRFSISPVKETHAAQLVKIQPNHTANFVVVHLKQIEAEGIILEDASGNILMCKDLPKSTKSYHLNLTDYDDGIYFLSIATDRFVTLEKFKIVKNTQK